VAGLTTQLTLYSLGSSVASGLGPTGLSAFQTSVDTNNFGVELGAVGNVGNVGNVGKISTNPPGSPGLSIGLSFSMNKTPTVADYATQVNSQ
jgi:hypothetical protein